AVVRSDPPPVRGVPRSALHRTARSLLRVVRRNSGARADAALRGGNAARSARHRAARSIVCGRLPRHELRRRIAGSVDAQEIGAPYTRFYMRPSYLANFLKIKNTAVRDWVSRLDRRVNARHSQNEIADFSRPVAC